MNLLLKNQLSNDILSSVFVPFTEKTRGSGMADYAETCKPITRSLLSLSIKQFSIQLAYGNSDKYASEL